MLILNCYLKWINLILMKKRKVLSKKKINFYLLYKKNYLTFK